MKPRPTQKIPTNRDLVFRSWYIEAVGRWYTRSLPPPAPRPAAQQRSDAVGSPDPGAACASRAQTRPRFSRRSAAFSTCLTGLPQRRDFLPIVQAPVQNAEHRRFCGRPMDEPESRNKALGRQSDARVCFTSPFLHVFHSHIGVSLSGYLIAPFSSWPRPKFS